MRVLCTIAIISVAWICVFAAPPDEKVFSKDVVMEKSLKVLGIGTNGDVDILEVDHNSNLKGDVRVGKQLNVIQNATIHQGATINQGLTVDQDLAVGQDASIGQNVNIDGNIIVGGDMVLDALSAVVTLANDFSIKVFEGAKKRVEQAARAALVDMVTYSANTGEFSINKGKLRYNPVTGISANDGSFTMDSTNGETEFNIRTAGETILQRKTPSKCALKLEEHPSNIDTNVDLFVVDGKSNFKNQVRIVPSSGSKRIVETLLVVEGDISVTGTVDSPGNVKDYDAVVAVQAVSGNLTSGDVFSAIASCPGGKKVTGGGCTIDGIETFGLVLRKSDPNGDAMQCEYMEVFADANGIDATISATVFCVTSL